MQYNPKDASQCLPAGEYQATIMKAVETQSKNGKDMLAFQFKIYGPGNRVAILTEYIVAEVLWKLKNIAKAVGQLAAFETGEFRESDYVGRNLAVALEVEESPEFGEQNRIKAYRVSVSGVRKESSDSDLPPPPQSRGADDIPFAWLLPLMIGMASMMMA